MTIKIPEFCLVVLIGPSGCGKSTFARAHFKPTEVLSSDFCRGLVSDDENSQSATNDAFEVLHFIASKRLRAGRVTVVDATNVQPEARKPLVQLAREYDVLPVAIVLNLPERLCQDRNRERPDRDFGPHVVRNQTSQLRRSLKGLQREGFRHVHVFSSPEEVDAVTLVREPVWNNLKHEHGPFDIIGDIHGCYAELVTLLETLGYDFVPSEGTEGEMTVRPPEGRRAIFLGDLVDRGPRIPAVLRLVMGMVEAGTAFCIPGNHEVKLLRKLRGKEVQVRHGLAESLEQLEKEPEEFRQRVIQFIDGLVSHYVLDDGKLVVAHAGMKEAYQGRTSARVREFALYGETTGETDEFGLPVRYNWAADYRGEAQVIYGHTPIPEPEWLNRTLNIDTGCVFGGKLTALRYPEREIVSVPAARVYSEPAKPFVPNEEASPLTVQQMHDDVLDLQDVLGKRIIHTRLQNNVTIREENAITALEVMSRFAADPKWLIYLPPTMSPSETSREPGLLEHPAEAFAYYRNEGIPHVLCEEKHMGSRAVVVLCRDEEAARRRFGVQEGGIGACTTRTGRLFFTDKSLESAFLDHLRQAFDASGLWEELETDWVCLDGELMPWSAKAQELLRGQYAAVGAASEAAMSETVSLLEAALQNQKMMASSASPELDNGEAGEPVDTSLESLLDRFKERSQNASRYRDAYRRYCWTVHSLADYRFAPFHLMASEGKVHTSQDHLWHMEILAKLCRADLKTDGSPSLLFATPTLKVDVTDPASEEAGIRWWTELTERGGEGMVVKPLEFIARGRRGIMQPAVKCRGREYLRIIYGPEYTEPENLERLRSRGLSVKRSLAVREFALGIEALERFVRKEPLRRVHECVFGVLALESEPVDPRL